MKAVRLAPLGYSLQAPTDSESVELRVEQGDSLALPLPQFQLL